MGLKETIVKKLQQATCDKIALNRQVLCWCKACREIEKYLNGSHKKK